MVDLISEYQSLLRAEESLGALDRAIDLTRRVAQGGRIVNRRRWPRLVGEDGGTHKESTSPTVRRILEVANVLRSLPLRAQEPDVPEAQFSLLMDTLLIVFHQAYFSLLPKAAGRRAALLQAFDAFADELPNLADRFQVKGLVHLERGQVEQAVQAFQAALAATPSDRHDFLTRVQMLWSLLIEHDRVRDAFNCLQEVGPRVTRIDFEEFQNLLKTTFEEAQKPRTATHRSHTG